MRDRGYGPLPPEKSQKYKVLGDDALISQGSFMQTKYLCVLIHICIKVVVGAVKPV